MIKDYLLNCRIFSHCQGGVPEGRGGINPDKELIKHDPALQNTPFKFPPEGGKNPAVLEEFG
jgi:hypothetical protein